MITIVVLEQERYDGNWPPYNLLAAIEWFQARLAEIPEEYRHTATLDIDSVSGYGGSHFAKIRIVYERPFTPEDMAEGERHQRLREEAKKAAELMTLRALRAKYGE
jgi:hypothetical protein